MAGHTYRFLTSRPLFAFGFGLGYSDIRVLSAKTVFGGVLVKLRNEGGRDGVQTVQMYVRKPDDKAAPLKTLRAFKRVEVPAGRSRCHIPCHIPCHIAVGTQFILSEACCISVNGVYFFWLPGLQPIWAAGSRSGLIQIPRMRASVAR